MFFFIFDYHFDINNWGEAIFITFIEVVSYAVIIYINLYLLIPYSMRYKSKMIYILSILLLIIFYILFLNWTGLESKLYEHDSLRNILSTILNALLFIMISTLFWYFDQWYAYRETKLKLESERLELELDFLRSQISPHFIFNNLNNIYSLALQKHENTAPMISKLAQILRYVLYDTQIRKVTLSKELLVVQHYIDLHMFRQPASTNIDFFSEGDDSQWSISPMLLLDFVENCFKYSNLHQDEQAWINIYTQISDDGLFTLKTENSCHEAADFKKGIGLKNAERQLQLNYTNAYSMSTARNENIFSLCLIIQLKKNE